MLFLNHKGKKYSFILLLVILQNSYADDVKSQESRQELQSVDETNPIEEAENFQGNEEDRVSSRINDQYTEDVPSVQTSRALDESTQEEESDQSNPLEDGFIVLPLKSRRLLTEGLTISPNDISPTSRSLNNRRPAGSRTEIVLPSLKELDKMKAAAREKRARERAERQRRKKERRNSENESSRYEFRAVPPPINRRFVENSGSKDRRIPPIFSKRRVSKRIGSLRDRTFEIPKLPEQPFEIPEMPMRKRLRKPKLDDTEENDMSLPSEFLDLRDQEDDREDDPPSIIVDPTSEEINDGKYIPVWLPQ